MNTILYQRTKDLCDQYGITPEKLAETLGVSMSSIRKWKTIVPSVDKVKAVSEYFHVSIDYLVGLTDIPITAEQIAEDPMLFNRMRKNSDSGHQSFTDTLRVATRICDLDQSGRYTVEAVLQAEELRVDQESPAKKTKIIPLIGNSFAAGIGEPDFGNALEEYEIPEDVRADFAVRVNGDSMEPHIHDGQIVLGTKGQPKTGDIVAIMIDGSFYVKQIVIDSFGNLYLLSLNRAYPDIEVKASADSTVRCFGVIQMGRKIPLAH